MSQKRAKIVGNTQAQQLKDLIARGKEQGFLTYAEVNDHLPNDIVDPEQIEDIVNMINDMGITVHEKAPDAESLLLSDAAVSNDEDAAEEAEAALASVDAEFGRTTDPVRMYMREMGTVELLTRQGEIEIAKRIEDGLNQVKRTWRTSRPPSKSCSRFTMRLPPATRACRTLWWASSTRMRPTSSSRRSTRPTRTQTDDDEEEEVVDTGPDPEEVKARAKKIRSLLNRVLTALEKHGSKDKRTSKLRDELADQLMELKLAPKLTDLLVRSLRDSVAVIRTQERQVMQICVRDCGMPRKDFIASFPKSETNLEWIDKHIRAKRKHSSSIAKRKDDVLRSQRKLMAIETLTNLKIAEIKEINRQMSIGEAKARRAKKEMVEANLRLVISIAKKVHQSRPAIPRPDPGRQHRPDEGGRQVRVPARLQVLDLRHLVDSPGDYPLDR